MFLVSREQPPCLTSRDFLLLFSDFSEICDFSAVCCWQHVMWIRSGKSMSIQKQDCYWEMSWDVMFQPLPGFVKPAFHSLIMLQSRHLTPTHYLMLLRCYIYSSLWWAESFPFYDDHCSEFSDERLQERPIFDDKIINIRKAWFLLEIFQKRRAFDLL